MQVCIFPVSKIWMYDFEKNLIVNTWNDIAIATSSVAYDVTARTTLMYHNI